MHLVTLKTVSGPVPGVAVGDKILNLVACGSALPAAHRVPQSVRGILEGGDEALGVVRRVVDAAMNASGALKEQLATCTALSPRASTPLLAPIPDPQIVLSCGMNDRKHLTEMGGTIPAKPIAFVKNVGAIIGPGASIILPKDHPDMVDWEIELSGVIGKPCHRVSAADALDYVAGYTLVNDVTSRHLVKPVAQMHGLEAAEAFTETLLGKQFPTFCPLGPAIATKDEIEHPDDIHYELRVNDTVRQSATTANLIFSLASLISYYSHYFNFRPGDVITTGSPSGVGYSLKPQVFLKPGDVVTMSADGIGTMMNPVAAA